MQRSTVTFKAMSDGSLTQRPPRGLISWPPAATQKHKREGEESMWRLSLHVKSKNKLLLQWLLSPHMKMKWKCVLPRCTYVESMGMKNGGGPSTSLLAIAGRKNGKDPFHVLGCSSLVQRISETKKIDDEIFFCWRQWQNSYSLLQGQDLPLFKKLIMSCKSN